MRYPISPYHIPLKELYRVPHPLIPYEPTVSLPPAPRHPESARSLRISRRGGIRSLGPTLGVSKPGPALRGLGVKGLGLLGFRGLGLGFRVSGLGFRVSGLGFGVRGSGLGVWGLPPEGGWGVGGLASWVQGADDGAPYLKVQGYLEVGLEVMS